ncbi:MAG: phage tail protein [Dehalococcoidales bacterium]|nr:MAG: phage tail protein [Dehalococcoidales bacterium]
MADDPLLGFNFGLEFQGAIAGYFTECNGIGSENEVIDHKVVDDSGREITKKIPGRLKWGDITLKRGITEDMQIWDWREDVVQGDMDGARKNGSVVMMDRNYNTVARWNFENAWPSKVSGPSMKSDSNEFGIEELVIVHEGIYRES